MPARPGLCKSIIRQSTPYSLAHILKLRPKLCLSHYLVAYSAPSLNNAAFSTFITMQLSHQAHFTGL